MTDERYSLRRLVEIIGLSRSVVMRLVAAGCVTPSRGPRGEYRFGFQDMVLLRTAYHLQAASIPPRRLLAALRELRAKLPEDAPLAGLRLKAFGAEVAVKRADAPWESHSGQLVMDFEVGAEHGAVRVLPRGAPASADDRGAADWFLEGERLEASDPAGAEHAYRRALTEAPDHVDASINLGVLLCEARRCGEALAVFEDALTRTPDEPLLLFNTAIALEDQHRIDDAIERYEQCLGVAPDMGDAHFNLARLHEARGDARGALRHFNAYRRLHKDMGS